MAKNAKTNPKEKTQKSGFKKALGIIGTILVVVYVVAAIAFSMIIIFSSGDDVPSIFGYTLHYVQTDSMEPNINTDDFVLCKGRTNYEDLKVNDIIAFKAKVFAKPGANDGIYRDAEDDTFTEMHTVIKIHRIIEVQSDGRYTTKGDNVDVPDITPVHPASVIGVYSARIPKVGVVFNFVKTQTGILVCFVIPLAVFFFYALYVFVRSLIEYKASKRGVDELTDEQKQAAIAEYLAKQAAQGGDNAEGTEKSE